MSTTENDRKASLRKWGTVGFCVAVGVLYFVAGWLGGDQWFAVAGLLLMIVLAAGVLVASRHSETIGGLLNGRDERINAIDSTATNVACMVLIAAILIGFITEIAKGEDGMPYAMLGAIGGFAYLIALVTLRLRK